MDVADFDFELPPEAIAQRPAPRGTARLLTLDRATGAIGHRSIADLPALLRPGDVLVLNDTKVIPARIFGTDERGRRTEFLLVERVPEETEGTREDSPSGPELWRCLAKPGRRVKTGRTFFFEGGWKAGAIPAAGAPLEAGASNQSPSKKSAETRNADGGLYLLRFVKHGSKEHLLDALAQMGSAPLPPYIHRPDGVADAQDRVDYQTVFAREPGAIAAPTAGLHFTEEMLAKAAGRGVEVVRVTLHVGIGTFKPVKAARVEDHRMDFERAFIPEETAAAVNRAKDEGRRVVAVGTTSVRTLEASARAHAGRVAPGAFETDLFLVPGAEFRVVDAILTNLHLPRSTLLMLVSAFAGRERVLAAYAEAIRAGYRFFSYGDAMFVSGGAGEAGRT
ncbi:MAG TPA: tRNA preQ1(34) S-adenosylmethionine ribosyltransferase-isomerase QueA [Thermoanaerobaculia bacterium]|nr:tRNA preQ1(34) S-adenosylmethionine ribosyltransferase-isomerase QueA [Thermoanaerobaculia bacterium]